MTVATTTIVPERAFVNRCGTGCIRPDTFQGAHMALPGKQSGGGGYLNNVAGTIVGAGYESTVWEKKGKEPYTTVSLRIDVKQDGADASVKQFMQAGFLNDEELINDDGTIEADHAVVAVGSEAHRFLESFVEANPDAMDALVASNLNDPTPLVNARVTFRREVNEEAKAAGKRERFKTKAGKDVEKDPTMLLVKEYHGQVAPGKSAKSASKPASKTGAAPVKASAKVNGKAAVADADALIETAETVLTNILKGAGKPVDRSALSAKIVRYSTENKLSDDAAEHNAIRESLRKLIGSEDFLGRENGWTFSAGAKGQPVEFVE